MANLSHKNLSNKQITFLEWALPLMDADGMSSLRQLVRKMITDRMYHSNDSKWLNSLTMIYKKEYIDQK